jgi:hypothetical protein
MTDEEGQRIKARLIELGFWGVDEWGDPTANIHDAGKLNDRLQAKLAKKVFLVSRIPFGRSWGREVVIFHIHGGVQTRCCSNLHGRDLLGCFGAP